MPDSEASRLAVAEATLSELIAKVREDHVEFREMRSEIAVIGEAIRRVEIAMNQRAETHVDHEARIRKLEDSRTWIAGAMAVISIIAAVAYDAIKGALRGH